MALTAITAARTVTLPAPSSRIAGKIVIVLDQSGLVSAILTLTIVPAAGGIGGAASKVLTVARGALISYCDGSNWFTLSGLI